MNNEKLTATDHEIEQHAFSLAKKIATFFNAALKEELSNFKGKNATFQQIINIASFALSHQNAEVINTFLTATNDPLVALNMPNVILEVTQKMVQDFYMANREEINANS